MQVQELPNGSLDLSVKIHSCLFSCTLKYSYVTVIKHTGYCFRYVWTGTGSVSLLYTEIVIVLTKLRIFINLYSINLLNISVIISWFYIFFFLTSNDLNRQTAAERKMLTTQLSVITLITSSKINQQCITVVSEGTCNTSQLLIDRCPKSTGHLCF